MRFLVSEKAYETPIASGLLRYEQHEIAIDVIETWRLTVTTHGDQILRVDYDSRAVDGRSFLYHFVITQDNEPQRLVYRYLNDDGSALSGNVLFSVETMLNSRKIGEAHFEEELPMMPILFPTVIGAGFAARALGRRRGSAEIATLDMNADGNNRLKLHRVTTTIRPQRTRDLKIIRVGRNTHRATTLTLEWGSESHQLWLDLKHRWPLKMARENGIVAQETRYIRY